MRLCLVEDHAVAGLEPIALTRPAHELVLGASSLGAKIARGFGASARESGMVIRSHLAPIERERSEAVAVNDSRWLGDGPVVVANARWVPPAGFAPPAGDGPAVGLCRGEVAFVRVGPGRASGLNPHNVDDWLDGASSEPGATVLEVGGDWIGHLWDLVARNAEHLERDFAAIPHDRRGLSPHHRATIALVGPEDRLAIAPSARIDPYVVLDTTAGPITLEEGAWVQPFTRLEGPCHVGRDTQLFRANVRGAVTIGPNCRIGGEVEASIVHGHSNKYHEGFLGHAYVGEWVNLGAITSNSDLRNDYGEVSVPLQGDPVPTGMAKVGCFIGDHTRTGMGSMLNTGTAVGVMCNVLPAGRLLPKHIPSFTAVLHGRVSPGFALDQLFATARIVMGRRGRAFTPAEEQLYRVLNEQTRLERERAFHRAREPRGDNWPVLAARS